MSVQTNALYPSPASEHTTRISSLQQQLVNEDLPIEGLTDTDAQLDKIKNAVPNQSEPTYFGFVTGGVTPAAFRADNIVTELDANVAVHLPDVSIATVVEDTALRWLLQLYNLDPTEWRHRIVTTGATASNVLGLACGRDYVVRQAGRKTLGTDDLSVGSLGLFACLRKLGVDGIRVLTSGAHSSLIKAASIVGLGRETVIDLTDPARPPRLDLARLKKELSDKNFLHIVAVSCGEVNTGRFATDAEDMREIRALCDEHGAWVHVDGGK
jgi:glutamate/tyrosine decarboxylase-like PLP-dependent enzyme